jgi:hypothetical protein
MKLLHRALLQVGDKVRAFVINVAEATGHIDLSTRVLEKECGDFLTLSRKEFFDRAEVQAAAKLANPHARCKKPVSLQPEDEEVAEAQDSVGAAVTVLCERQQHLDLAVYQATKQSRPDPSCKPAHASNAVMTHCTDAVGMSVTYASDGIASLKQLLCTFHLMAGSPLCPVQRLCTPGVAQSLLHSASVVAAGIAMAVHSQHACAWRHQYN